MTTNDSYEHALAHWKLALKYLHLVKVIAGQIVACGNNFIATWHGNGKEEPTPEEVAKKLDEQTKWSDVWLIEPFLFNLYHGLELMLKGFVLLDTNASREGDHKLSDYIQRCKKMYPAEQVAFGLIDKYIDVTQMPDLLREFFEMNNSTADDYYQLLRYPFDFKFTKKHAHFNLKYKGEDGIPFFTELTSDLDEMRRASVRLGKSMKK